MSLFTPYHTVLHICEHRDRAGTDLALQSGTGIRSLNLLVAVGWWVEEGNGVLMSHEAILVSLSQALSLCMHTHTSLCPEPLSAHPSSGALGSLGRPLFQAPAGPPFPGEGQAAP